MGSPTLIRHAVRGDSVITVTTVFERESLASYVQVYKTNGVNDTLFLEHSEVWLDEQQALISWAKLLEDQP